MMLRAISIILFLSLFYNDLISQNNDLWYFSNITPLAVDFSNGPPVSIPFNGNSQISSMECTAIIKDDNGDLLFYTQGTKLFDVNHQLVPNGDGLYGDESSMQGALFVPLPGNSDIIYLFTTNRQAGWGNATHAGMCYSVIDRTLNSGTGDIPANEKNITLVDSTAEKLTAVRHSNGRDIWIITVGYNSNKKYAFLLRPDGLCSPVITETGTVHYGGTNQSGGGQLKANHTGSKLANPFKYLKMIDIYDFDNSTGIFSNPIILSLTDEPHGLEISPNDQFMYIIAQGGNIYQYDISLGTQSSISNSKLTVGNTVTVGMLQIGPDQKIYWPRFNTNYLGVIEFPDSAGSSCSPNLTGLSLTGATNIGLPNFFKGPVFVDDNLGFIEESIALSFGKVCVDEPVTFYDQSNGNDLIYSWQFSEGSISDDQNPMLIFSEGNYNLTYTISNVCTTLTLDTIFDAEPCLPNNYFLPKAFSPNNDGVNDFLQLHGNGIAQISLNIYDRYGNKVYETDNTAFKWYGEKTTNQVLIYFLDLTFEDGENIFKKGNLTIIK